MSVHVAPATVMKCVDRLVEDISAGIDREIALCDSYISNLHMESAIRRAENLRDGSHGLFIYRPKHTRVATMKAAYEYLSRNIPSRVKSIVCRTSFTDAGAPDLFLYVTIEFPHPDSFLNEDARWRIHKAASIAADDAVHALEAVHESYDALVESVKPAVNAAWTLSLDAKADPECPKDKHRKLSSLANQLSRDVAYMTRVSSDEDYRYARNSAIALSDAIWALRAYGYETHDNAANLSQTVLDNFYTFLQNKKDVSVIREKAEELAENADNFDKVHYRPSVAVAA